VNSIDVLNAGKQALIWQERIAMAKWEDTQLHLNQDK